MKSGFVSIIGRTNAGKSSLLNALLNEKITIVSHKQNATRRKINGIVMHKDNQVIFIDTPGLHKSEKVLNKLMIEDAKKAMSDCDAIVFMASVYDSTLDYEEFLQLNPQKPHILVISKVDKVKNDILLKKISEYQKFQDKFIALIPFSIKGNSYNNLLLDEIVKILPEHEYFFDPDFITNTNEKEIFKEFILESIYENLSDEIPYSSDVIIDKVIEKDQIIEIYSTIITEKKSHKSMIIGKDGSTLKRIGIHARKLICNLVGKKIFLKTNVIIKKGWTKDEKFISSQNLY
ncbi:GTPase Era [Campylobacter pinnipediorum subsp. pinnipediorum]|uniref:GTPase Era n=1 Tax=Campylobacter pinnipediorum subsp. pinnipediorum TaxID=1660067 RepID=A0AAX0LAZ0_9BACT|nr:GTPase Era [Campylobacter pinnipediorum]OPA77980.1 GTPase Era [Campylobacter pinnipediorum subsp. pinnipediorum]OPA78144.1 GTPase Era [Campylobacter pinnipediorum subsp. pinnipediorum]